MNIRWTPLAVGHLESAHDYIVHHNPEAADDLIERILQGVERLEHHPQMGRAGRVSGTHEFVVTGTPFVIGYRLRKDHVEILAVLHGSRRWPGGF